MNFDIRSIVPSETAFMQIRDIEGNPQYAEDGSEPGIEFYGPGTREAKAAETEYLSRLKKLIDAKKDGDFEEVNRIRVTYLSKLTKRFVGFDFEGGPAAMYRDIEYAHVVKDGFAFIGEQGNFKKSS